MTEKKKMSIVKEFALSLGIMAVISAIVILGVTLELGSY